MMAEPPPPDRLADAPDPPSMEVNNAFFLALEQIVKELEDARTELTQLHAMLRCLADALKYADDDDSVINSDVAIVVARLLNDVVTDLELTKNQIPTSKEMAPFRHGRIRQRSRSMSTDASPLLASQTALTHRARKVLSEQLQNIFAVYGLLATLEKAISNHSYGDSDLIAFADCARAGKIILDHVTDALDSLKVQLPEE
jgi:hypothetical protein